MPLIENVLTGLWKLMGTNAGQDTLMWASEHKALPENPRAMYRLRRMLYDNQWAFAEMESDELILGLRNPTAAAVNYHGFTTWPGTLPEALPIETDFTSEEAKPLVKAIHQVWQWSDWQTNKQVYARNKARDGDALIQIATRNGPNGRPDQVYFHLVDVEHLTDFDVDNRGFVTWLRLDIPKERRKPNGDIGHYTLTEVWDKDLGTYRGWQHDQGLVADIGQLGEPLEELTIESMTGTNMLPFVHGKHLSMGHKRGAAAIDHALVKIHEASRMATRLHSMAFQYGEPDMQLTSVITHDREGRPIQKPNLTSEDNRVKLGRKNFWNPPAGFRIDGLGLDVAYEALRAILADHMQHIQEGDLVMLAYYKLASSSRDLSGEALGHMLKPAVELAIEVRGNSESELVRANQMALTIGTFHKLPGFTDLGTYENGDFDHRFAQRDIIPMTATERAEVEKARAETAIIRQGYGWSDRALLKEDGLTEEEITVMNQEQQATEAERGARLLNMSAAGGIDREL